MTSLQIPVHSTKGMSFCNLTNTFCEEISTLSQGGTVPLYDFVSKSLKLKSHVTGVEVMFIFTRVEKNADNDVISWTFIANYNNRRLFLKVFND